jgi:hypothetical protein
VRPAYRIPLLLALPLLAAGDPPPKPKVPAPPLSITKDERAMLLGFMGRDKAIRLQAERDLEAVAAEQREYLARVATRLGLDPGKALSDHTVNLDTMVVTPRQGGRP